MCVIAYKAKKVRFPSDKNIREMWDRNPDGAGIMWRDASGCVSFAKGFMKLAKFMDFVEKNRGTLEDSECALHFRITTHGGTSPGNCHPFVVSSRANPHALRGRASRIVMHNGVLPLVPRRKDISDTAELALRLGSVDDPEKTLKCLDECLSGNRVILMDENGTHFHGDAFKKSTIPENEGILYSNLNWEPFVPSLPKGGGGTCAWPSYSYAGFDDYEDFRPLCGSEDDGDVAVCERHGFLAEDCEVLKEEAKYYGLGLEEYIEWAYECAEEHTA